MMPCFTKILKSLKTSILRFLKYIGLNFYSHTSAIHFFIADLLRPSISAMS